MEKAVLIGLITPDVTKEQAYEYLDELAFLTDTAGAKPVRNFTQKLPHPDNKTFLGKGKIEEVRLYAEENEIKLIIFDDDLSPSQIRNIEKVFGEDTKVLDRSNLILDIFASRAQTAQARTQVELAQYQYLLPRLTRMWTHLERQKGGIGLRGPGETQLETDRRLVGQRIKTVKKKLDKTHKQKEVNRYSRKKSRNKLAAFVGYTNVGKTTLFNLLTDNLLYAADKPFATLDSVTRRNAIPELGSILFSDTVGFISDLPTQLIESFKATLDELKSADLLIHVIDISDKDFRFKTKQVLELLEELNLSHIPLLKVNNKSDKAKIEGYENLSKPEESEVWISAEEETGISHLIKSINLSLRGGIYRGWVSMNPSLGDIRSKLYSSRSVIDETTSKSGLLQLKLEIGNDELLELKSLNGFDLLDNKITI